MHNCCFLDTAYFLLNVWAANTLEQLGITKQENGMKSNYFCVLTTRNVFQVLCETNGKEFVSRY